MENVLGNPQAIEIDGEFHSNCSKACAWLLRLTGPVKVLEIGTSYGRQLPSFVPLSSETVCIDPMYDWVPDVKESEGFDPSRVNGPKVAEWNMHAAPFRSKIRLVLGNSYTVWSDPTVQAQVSGASILIVDGCHAPRDLVLKDYTNFRHFLSDPHYVIWDDVSFAEVGPAIDMARSLLQNECAELAEKRFNDAHIMWVKRHASVVQLEK